MDRNRILLIGGTILPIVGLSPSATANRAGCLGGLAVTKTGCLVIEGSEEQSGSLTNKNQPAGRTLWVAKQTR